MSEEKKEVTKATKTAETTKSGSDEEGAKGGDRILRRTGNKSLEGTIESRNQD